MVMKAATITVRTSKLDEEALDFAFKGAEGDYSFSKVSAPANRGIEIHVSSARLGKAELKDALRKYRALSEAGETPTGARRP